MKICLTHLYLIQLLCKNCFIYCHIQKWSSFPLILMQTLQLWTQFKIWGTPELRYSVVLTFLAALSHHVKTMCNLFKKLIILGSIHDQAKSSVKEQKLYEKLKALNRYHKRSFAHSLAYFQSMAKRTKVLQILLSFSCSLNLYISYFFLLIV